MIWLVAMALALPAEPDCGRWAVRDLRACEIDRSENDVLDAAHSVPAHELGDGGIRFSSVPALGGDAYVLEFRRNRRGGARARFTWLDGHPRWRWRKEERWDFDISPAVFRELTAIVDGAMARIHSDPGPTGPDAPETIVCTDGPGFLTERVKDRQVVSMTGFCPYSCDDEHPNRAVEAAMLNVICPRFGWQFNPHDGIGEACVGRARRLRSAHR